MARDLRSESEFGLPQMPLLPSVDGEPNALGVTGMTDQDAIDAGATATSVTGEGGADALAHELRSIYAQGSGKIGPGRVGNADLQP